MNHGAQKKILVEDRTLNKSQTDSFRRDVLHGLSLEPKELPCKYFYDTRGSDLFDQICELDEYYLTRSELAIMELHAEEMAQLIRRSSQVIELGSGSGVKTRMLLDALVAQEKCPIVYMPIDVSAEYLRQVSAKLQSDYPEIEVLPIAADFTRHFDLPLNRFSDAPTTVYFPGSTIGNFTPSEALNLLQLVSRFCKGGGGMLIGIDLVKEVATLEAAYNDKLGITAEFNLNLLHRMTRELGAQLDLEAFEHLAYFNPHHSRIEIYLQSLREQVITIDSSHFPLRQGERIHTEYSHKYTLESFSQLALQAGLVVEKAWRDSNEYFAVVYAVAQ